jgi:synaptic vesicle membrane protein VAT-1
MKCIVVAAPGGPEVLKLIHKPNPIPGSGEYLISVRASGVNFADSIARQGLYAAAKGKYPLVPGFDFAGVIDAKGENTNKFEVGDRVYGFTLFGGYSSHHISKSEFIRKIPDHLSFVEAASLPTAHLTAYHILHNAAHIRPSETVLVHSAAGGVGLALVQQAKLAHCKVIAVVGNASKLETPRQFGADHVFVHDSNLWRKIDKVVPNGIDASFDANGITTLKPAFARLRCGGRLIIFGFAEMLSKNKTSSILQLAWNYLRIPKFSPFSMTSKNKALIGVNLAFLGERLDLATIAMNTIDQWARDGSIQCPPICEIPIENVEDAHRLIESGTSAGKIILIFGENTNY